MYSASDLINVKVRTAADKRRLTQQIEAACRQPPEFRKQLGLELRAIVSDKSERPQRRGNAAAVLTCLRQAVDTDGSLSLRECFEEILQEEFSPARVDELARTRKMEFIFFRIIITFSVKLRPPGGIGMAETLRDNLRDRDLARAIGDLIRRSQPRE